jgi:hypothetical protein
VHRQFSWILGFVLLVGCASQRPVLYPNDQLKRVGNTAASRDIDDCMRQAEQYVSDRRVGKSVEGAVAESGTSAAIGAAAGAAGGAVVGRAGTSAAIGAAGGGAAGATRGLFHAFSSKHGPSPVYKNFVNRCLRERGYEPLGWD